MRQGVLVIALSRLLGFALTLWAPALRSGACSEVRWPGRQEQGLLLLVLVFCMTEGFLHTKGQTHISCWECYCRIPLS